MSGLEPFAQLSRESRLYVEQVPHLAALVLDASVCERAVDRFERGEQRADLLGREHVERLRVRKLHEGGRNLLGTRRESVAG